MWAYARHRGRSKGSLLGHSDVVIADSFHPAQAVKALTDCTCLSAAAMCRINNRSILLRKASWIGPSSDICTSPRRLPIHFRSGISIEQFFPTYLTVHQSTACVHCPYEFACLRQERPIEDLLASICAAWLARQQPQWTEFRSLIAPTKRDRYPCLLGMDPYRRHAIHLLASALRD